METRDLQALLRATTHPRLVVDGLYGPSVQDAVAAVGRLAMPPLGWPAEWPAARRRVAATQYALNRLGHHAGAVDGHEGHNTLEALEAWRLGPAARIPSRDKVYVAKPSMSGAARYPSQAERAMVEFYGPKAGLRCTAGTVRLPFPFVIAWDETDTVETFRCHELLEETLTELFQEAVDLYGEREFRRLRLHYFGGCFNDRPMRGGTRPSTHSWGAAVDLDPANNRLRQRSVPTGHGPAATFSRPEYARFWDLVAARGLTSLGRARDMDWMHLQACAL